MSQHDYDIANQTAPNFRSDLNDALGAIATNNSGATEPSVTYANQWWYDASNDILKIRSEADDAWINVGYLDQSTNEFKPYVGGTQVDTQSTAAWEAGTSTTEGIVSPAKVKAAIDANTPEQGGMTLVDTIAVSGGFASTSITFSDYEMILCIVNQVSFNINGTSLEVRLAGTDYLLSPDSDTDSGSLSGMIEINVPTGFLKSHLKDSDSGGEDFNLFVAGDLSGETSIGFDPAFGRDFDSGQILVYGVK